MIIHLTESSRAPILAGELLLHSGSAQCPSTQLHRDTEKNKDTDFSPGSPARSSMWFQCIRIAVPPLGSRFVNQSVSQLGNAIFYWQSVRTTGRQEARKPGCRRMPIAMMMMMMMMGRKEIAKSKRKILFEDSSASIYYYIVALKCTFKGLCKLFSLIRILVMVLAELFDGPTTRATTHPGNRQARRKDPPWALGVLHFALTRCDSRWVLTFR